MFILNIVHFKSNSLDEFDVCMRERQSEWARECDREKGRTNERASVFMIERSQEMTRNKTNALRLLHTRRYDRLRLPLTVNLLLSHAQFHLFVISWSAKLQTESKFIANVIQRERKKRQGQTKLKFANSYCLDYFFHYNCF